MSKLLYLYNKCNPFTNIKESECLLKWQLLRLDLMTRAYMATISEYKKIAPLQEKMYRRMSREMEEMDEADKWKLDDDEHEDEDHSRNRQDAQGRNRGDEPALLLFRGGRTRLWGGRRC